MTCKLNIKVLAGPSAGDVFHYTLEEGEQLLIGRSIDCNLVLQDTHISRKHVSILYKVEDLYLADLGSTLGTIHMGFELQAGEENARILRNGDEFKLGEMLFQVDHNLSSAEQKKEDRGNNKREKSNSASSINHERWKKFFQKNKILIIIALVGLLALLLIPGEEHSGLPAQKSAQVLLLPNYGAAGYYRSARRDEDDQTHLDKAQFELPASDALIEYSYISKVPISLKIDEVEVEKLLPSISWKKRQLIIRGLDLGMKRKLIFDNLSYPNLKELVDLEQLSWAVKDVRALPLSSKTVDGAGFAKEIEAVLAIVEGVDKTPDGLFSLLRALQTSIVILLEEMKIDSISIEVDTEAEPVINFSDIASLRQRLELLKTSYQAASGGDNNLLTDLSKIVAEIDAELWRRLNSRLTQAKLAAKVKNYIEAHDNLFSALKMFPEEADYRWSLANKLFQNPEIVPKKFKDKPERYRKNGH